MSNRFIFFCKIYSMTRIIYRKNRNYEFYRAFEFVGCASNSSRDISKILFFWVKSGQSILYIKIIFAKNVSNRFIFFRKIYSKTRIINRKNRNYAVHSAFEFVGCASNISRDISKTLFFWGQIRPEYLD